MLAIMIVTWTISDSDISYITIVKLAIRVTKTIVTSAIISDVNPNNSDISYKDCDVSHNNSNISCNSSDVRYNSCVTQVPRA